MAGRVAEPKYLLDTNVCIRVLAGTAPCTVEWLQTLAVGEAAVSAITYAEFLRGALRRPAQTVEELEQQIPAQTKERQFFQQVPVLSFGEAEALEYRQLLAKKGLPGRLRADWLIAAHALALDAIMITDDLRFPRLEGLEVHLLDEIESEGRWP